jgi:hypothetical protein
MNSVWFKIIAYIDSANPTTIIITYQFISTVPSDTYLGSVNWNLQSKSIVINPITGP